MTLCTYYVMSFFKQNKNVPSFYVITRRWNAYNSWNLYSQKLTLQWRYNERDGVSNRQRHDCLLNRLYKAQIIENIKASRQWPLWGKFDGDRRIPRTKGL